jgi:hypothetical protein
MLDVETREMGNKGIGICIERGSSDKEGEWRVVSGDGGCRVRLFVLFMVIVIVSCCTQHIALMLMLQHSCTHHTRPYAFALYTTEMQDPLVLRTGTA